MDFDYTYTKDLHKLNLKYVIDKNQLFYLVAYGYHVQELGATKQQARDWSV